jgi:hypothetical protein
MDLPNITYNGDISKFIYADDDYYDAISYFKDKDYFIDITNYSKFIKAVERMVRTSKEYSGFVSYIKSVLGINFCQVNSKITDEDATIEMHHGPLFTLYDICEVILNFFIKSNMKINTFRVSNAVIEEHYALRVQVVMLAITNHEAFHNRDLFLNIQQGIGDIDSFIKKYTPYLTDDQKYKIWNYINLCENNEGFSKSFDKGLLDTEYIKKYVKI